MRRWKRYAVSSSLATIIVVTVAWLLKPVGREFDAALWKHQTKVQSGVRQGMADRLMDEHGKVSRCRLITT